MQDEIIYLVAPYCIITILSPPIMSELDTETDATVKVTLADGPAYSVTIGG
jgi:hypothetical protein